VILPLALWIVFGSRLEVCISWLVSQFPFTCFVVLADTPLISLSLSSLSLLTSGSYPLDHLKCYKAKSMKDERHLMSAEDETDETGGAEES
jgi:hypothetical protein